VCAPTIHLSSLISATQLNDAATDGPLDRGHGTRTHGVPRARSRVPQPHAVVALLQARLAAARGAHAQARDESPRQRLPLDRLLSRARPAYHVLPPLAQVAHVPRRGAGFRMFKLEGFGFRAWRSFAGLRLGVRGLVYGVWGLGSGVWGLGLGFVAWGLRFGVQDLGLTV